MRRSDLIAALAAQFPHLARTNAEASVKLILKTILDALAQGARVEIRNFGSFSVHQRPARTGRNPATGQSIRVPAKYVPHFKPGKDMRERVAAAARDTTRPASGK